MESAKRQEWGNQRPLAGREQTSTARAWDSWRKEKRTQVPGRVLIVDV